MKLTYAKLTKVSERNWSSVKTKMLRCGSNGKYIILLVCRLVVEETRKKLLLSMQAEQEAISKKQVVLHTGHMMSWKTEFSAMEKL